ncbi:amidohydrolase [Desulforhopalus sp. IMCC35007]|nr:amidohydrolase [Desulforhopalus sp. IMCC35007]
MGMSWKQIIAESKASRRELHVIPETCWQEFKTFKYLTERLNGLEIRWRRCAKTGIVAQLAQDAPGEHLALRADMDGLFLEEANTFAHRSTEQGCMHGCGHDGHMAVALAIAHWLKVNEKALPGPVSLIFQPAEEGGFGAKAMIEDGALEGIDKIFGWHNWPAIPYGKVVCKPGVVMAANASFTIVVKGSGGHASQPEICRDPVLAAAAITLGLQQIVSRRTSPQQAVVVSVTSIDARSGLTVIPDKAVLQGSVRAGSTEGLHKIGALIEQAACSIAKGYDVEADVHFSLRYPSVINTPDETDHFDKALAAVFGADYQCLTTAVPLMASEDFSYYLEKIPGAFVLVGAGDGGRYSIPCHNSTYDFNDQLIEPVVSALSLLVGAPLP